MRPALEWRLLTVRLLERLLPVRPCAGALSALLLSHVPVRTHFAKSAWNKLNWATCATPCNPD
ncbi:hypothetical protein STVIR_7036 [Streptomyces viridochromogenes Tue57]|uniref:Uncharacterized protein n=1 Tax=Streptomyces viridochromogenes Tue57 TaxID=1160705 RepID=L8P704_STRVR|nr:hypothetical protein STVIR_7036 [Streptomyces viridochromogenes Tue57]